MYNQRIDRDAPEWEPVRKFFGGHLHQDYDAEYRDEWEAVRDFATGATPSRIAGAIRGLRLLLASYHDDSELLDATYLLGLGYYPPADGLTYRQWLEGVATFLESQGKR